MDTCHLSNGQLDVMDALKFYFWINVAGITTITDGMEGTAKEG